MRYIKKIKTGKGYTELLKIHKSGGCYASVKNNIAKSIYTYTNLLNDLLKEQKYLCAYCMSRIDNEKAAIEHIVGQGYIDSNYKKSGEYLDTDYDNLLAVCDGKYCKDSLHCDRSRATYQQGKHTLLFISPLNELQMWNITFSKSGKIEYKIENKDIEHDLNVVLNLNCQTLVENRKRVKDAVKNILIKKRFDKKYTKKLLADWNSCGEPYSQVAIEELGKHIIGKTDNKR